MVVKEQFAVLRERLLCLSKPLTEFLSTFSRVVDNSTKMFVCRCHVHCNHALLSDDVKGLLSAPVEEMLSPLISSLPSQTEQDFRFSFVEVRLHSIRSAHVQELRDHLGRFGDEGLGILI